MNTTDRVPGLPPRPPDSHKGTYGRVLVLAGSPGMPGAAVLTARAALRAGAGLVAAAVPESLSTTLGVAVPEATQLLLPEPDAKDHGQQVRDRLLPRLESGADSVAIGPGLGVGEAARSLVEIVLRDCSLPRVLDADCLNLIAQDISCLQPGEFPSAPKRCVWTPHPGEFHRLTGKKPRTEKERRAACAQFAEETGGVVVLKGHRTVIAGEGRLHCNDTGNPGMATGGSGDVLTGILASLLGQGMEPFDAAVLGTYLHGLAGDLAADALGEAGLIAGDIVSHLPAAILRHVSSTSTGKP